MELENLHKYVALTDAANGSIKINVGGQHVASVYAIGGGYSWVANQSFFASLGYVNVPFQSIPACAELHTCVANVLGVAYDHGLFDGAVEIPDDTNEVTEGHGEKTPMTPTIKFKNKTPVGGDPSGLHGLEDYMALKDKKEKKMTNEEMTDAQLAKRERIVKALKKSKADFEKRYGADKAKGVMYATATKMAMKEEAEVELEEAIKPYISGDHGSGWSILDHTGKTVKTFHHRDYADHPIPNKKKAAYDDAVSYFNKNFKKLSKPVNEVAEELEQVDELSKDTLASYAKKASRSSMLNAVIAQKFDQKAARATSQVSKDSNAANALDFKKKSWKREDGVNKAIDRLTKEEVETIDEKKDPCWKGYKQLGMKNKGGKQVPNCIPEQEEIKEEGEVLGGTTATDPTSKTDAIARADFKLSAAGRKVRRRIVLKK